MSEISVSVILIVVRLLTPLTLLRWPVAGVFVNMLADGLDHPIAQHFGWGLFDDGRYPYFDKALDTWYLCFLFYIVSRQWTDYRAQRTATVLFFWRVCGVILFAVTGKEWVLIGAPNVFELFYLYWASAMKWFPKTRVTAQHLSIVVVALTVFKVADEIRIHWFFKSFDVFKNLLFPS